MVNGKQCKLQSIGDPGLVVDVAQIVLDNLLGRRQAHGDFLILTALQYQSDYLHFSGSEAITGAGADAIFFLHW